MIFIVEDGTGRFDSNALADIRFVDQYADDMGDLRWGYDLPELDPEDQILKKQRSIVAASRWLSASYIWKGSRAVEAQAFEWPRSVEQDEVPWIPVQIKYAVAEAASRIYAGINMSPDLARGGEVKSEKVGPIAITYKDDAIAGTTFGIIDSYVRAYSLGGLNAAFITTERV